MTAYRPTGSLPCQGPLLPIVSRREAKKSAEVCDQRNRINGQLEAQECRGA